MTFLVKLFDSLYIIFLYSYLSIMTTFEQFLEQVPRETKQKRIGNYVIEKTLGKGTFGKVKLATHIPTGEKVAIKILQKDKIVDVADVERVSRQIHILKLIRHPNIIQLYEIIQTPRLLFLVMEYMENGELFDYIVSKKRMDQAEAKLVFEQIINGVEYIHRLRIVHRDLKLENCLLDCEKRVKIVDFGLSNTYKPEERLKTACGSPCYAAPEMIEGKNPYQPLMVDIWSTGVILFAMVCGFLPFEDQDTPKLYKKILAGQFSISTHVSADLTDFIKRILTVDPTKRITIEQMRKHPWWKKYNVTLVNYYPEGLIVGYHKIPIEQQILNEMKSLDYSIQVAEKSLEANRHNNITTTYYLIFKRFLRNGKLIKNHQSQKEFDKAVNPLDRRSKNNLRPQDLLKLITTPVERSRQRSYFLGNTGKRNSREESKSIGVNNNSYRVDQIKRSHSKLNRQKKKSIEKDRTLQQQYFLKNHNKNSQKDKNKSLHKSINKSVSKMSKSGHKLNGTFDDQNKMRNRSVSTIAKNNKRSHQGSHMIGAQVGIDWPLQSRNKIDAGKVRNALRRK